MLEQVANNINWTAPLLRQWQGFYNTAPRVTIYGRSGNPKHTMMPRIPAYADLNQSFCAGNESQSTTVTTTAVLSQSTTAMTTATTVRSNQTIITTTTIRSNQTTTTASVAATAMNTWSMLLSSIILLSFFAKQ